MFFKTSKEIAITALAIALLIALQYLLSAVKGVELVTAVFLCFCFSFGIIKGVACALGFSLLRCFLFGFFPNVMILYLIYYPLFAVVCALLGLFFKSRGMQKGVVAYVVMILTALLFSALFTLIDNTITVMVLNYSLQVATAYFAASIPVMITQCVCAVITTAVLFFPLTRVFLAVNERIFL